MADQGEQFTLLRMKADGSEVVKESQAAAQAQMQKAEAVVAAAAKEEAAQAELEAAWDKQRDKERAIEENRAALREEGQAAFDQAVQEEIAAGQARMEAKEAAVAAEVEAEQRREAAVEQAEAGVRKADEDSAKAVEAAMSREEAALKQAMAARAAQLYDANRGKGMAAPEASALAQTQLAGEVDRMGKDAFTAKNLEERTKGVRGFAQALSLVSPEAGEAARGIHDVGEGMEFLKTAGGIQMLGLAAAVAVVGMAIKALNDSIEESKKKLQEWADAQQRIRGQTTERQGSMAETLAKAGKGSQEALDKGTNQARRLEEMGYSRQAAQDAVAATIDPSGANTISNEDQELLAAAVQTGRVDLGGKTPQERSAALRKALAFIQRNKADVQNAAVATKRPTQMMNQAAADGNVDALMAKLKASGMSDEQAKEYAQAMSQNPAGGPEYKTEFFSADAWTGKSSERRAAWEKANEGWKRLGNVGQQGGGRQVTMPETTVHNHNYFGPTYQDVRGPQSQPRMVGG